MKSNKPKWIIKIAIILAVIVLPLAYSLFYLGAFWDPYGKLTQLPVAIVNEDKGGIINDEQRNLGRELVNELKSDNSLKWEETDAATAATGLDGTAYYAVLTIPENFSGDISSADSIDKKTAQITFSANEKRNYLAAQILNRAVVETEEKLETKIDSEITAQLAEKLQEVPVKLQDLSGGLRDMTDGTAQLQTGLSDLQTGQNDLGDGALKLDAGLLRLLNGSQALSQNINDLHLGIVQIKSNVLSALPEMANAGDMTASLAGSMDKLVGGAQQVSDGLSQAAAGTSKLSEAASSVTSGIPALTGGIDQAASGAASLNAGVGGYVDGVNQLMNQNSALMTQLNAIYISAEMTDAQKVTALGQLLQTAASPDKQAELSKLSQSGDGLKAGAAQLAQGTGQLKASEKSLSDMKDGLMQLSEKLGQLSSGAAQVSGGVSQLQAKAGALTGLSDRLGALTNGLDQLDTGAQKLYAGSETLTSGLQTAKAGSSDIVVGTEQLQDGTTKLQEGVGALSDGITTAKTSVDDAIAAAGIDLKATDGLGAFAENPVNITEAPVNPVPNYGTAFAPYFISLSLYVGALIMYVGIYLDQDNKMPMLSRDSGRRFIRVGVFAGIGVIQAVGLALIVRYGLGITLVRPAAFYLSCVLTSFVFISIVQFFMVCLKDIGKFLSMLLLILQLTANGGTFPMELVPKFFNVIYPFMPMTYSVRLFKETISGGNTQSGTSAALILAAIGICFTIATMLFSAGGKARQRCREAVAAT